MSLPPPHWYPAARHRRAAGCARVLLALSLLAAGTVAMADTILRIGTGGIAGTYYPVGRVIAELVNEDTRRCRADPACNDPGIVALPQLSSGTLANLADLADGRVELALVQADQVSDEEAGDIALVSALYVEAVHVVVDADGPIQQIGALEGATVSIDEEDSGTHVNALAVLAEHGIGTDAFTAAYFKPEFAGRELREGRIDAFFIVAGTPTQSVSALADEHPVRLLAVDGEVAADITARYAYMAPVTIPAGTYAGVGTVETVGVEAYLVARRDLDEALVDRVMRRIWSREGRRALVGAHHPIGGHSLAESVEDKAIGVHPGVRAFLLEHGIDAD